MTRTYRVCVYTHTHTHTHIYIYIYIYIGVGRGGAGPLPVISMAAPRRFWGAPKPLETAPACSVAGHGRRRGSSEAPTSSQEAPEDVQDGRRGPQGALRWLQDGQRGLQEGLKRTPKRAKLLNSYGKTYIFSIPVFSAVPRSKTGPKAPESAPRRPKPPPRGPHDGPRWPHDGPRGFPGGPRGTQEGPRRAPGRPQGGPKGPRPESCPRKPLREHDFRAPRTPKRAPRRPKRVPKRPPKCPGGLQKEGLGTASKAPTPRRNCLLHASRPCTVSVALRCASCEHV